MYGDAHYIKAQSMTNPQYQYAGNIKDQESKFRIMMEDVKNAAAAIHILEEDIEKAAVIQREKHPRSQESGESLLLPFKKSLPFLISLLREYFATAILGVVSDLTLEGICCCCFRN